jgi:hypothetical protein
VQARGSLDDIQEIRSRTRAAAEGLIRVLGGNPAEGEVSRTRSVPPGRADE